MPNTFQVDCWDLDSPEVGWLFKLNSYLLPTQLLNSFYIAACYMVHFTCNEDIVLYFLQFKGDKTKETKTTLLPPIVVLLYIGNANVVILSLD